MTNTEIYDLLEENANLINQHSNPTQNVLDVNTTIAQILETQNKILRELLADIPEAGNDNTVRIGD